MQPPGAAIMAESSSKRSANACELPAIVPNPQSYKSDRPTSAPGESHTAPPGGGAPNVFSLYASPSISRKFSPRRSFQPAPTPTTKTLSFLECVLELLKGTIVHRRRSFMHHPQVYLWLTSDLSEIRYRFSRKGNVPVTEVVPLCNVSKLKGSDRELSLEFSDERKRVEFLFPSKGSADVWLSGLCCLVPSYASVRSRDQPVGLRENYDPLTDSWNGKKIESRKRLDGYILLGTIGKGSFGKVKLALSTQDRHFYAVKVLSKAMMRKRIRSIPVNGMYLNSRDFANLEAKDVNEIAVMQSLSHENVIRCIGVYNDTTDDRFYIVLEFVARGPIMSSAKLKGADPLSGERARKAFVDVLAGIEYLHHLKIAHRDIKPDNLLEAGDGTVKISDFGAAVKCETADGGGVAVAEYSTAGTPAFTAPEVAISDNTPRQKVNLLAADMWSLGATLYYMIFGRAPFIARSVFEMYDTICKQELEFPSGVDANSDVCVLIGALLQKNPERRATVEDVLRSAWLTRSAAVAEKVESIRRAVASRRGGVAAGGRADRDGSGVKTEVSGGRGYGRGRARGGWYKHVR
ncbi:Serine/threonine protein kinase [Gracilaria domingensis]|nr:Serine/threonine protein kinase [Gracilaria domingensis]